MCPCVWHSCLMGTRPLMWLAENIMTNHYTPPISIPLCAYHTGSISPYCPCAHDPVLYADCYDCTVKIEPLEYDLALAKLACDMTTFSTTADLWKLLISSPACPYTHSQTHTHARPKDYFIPWTMVHPFYPVIKQMYGWLSHMSSRQLQHSPQKDKSMLTWLKDKTTCSQRRWIEKKNER